MLIFRLIKPNHLPLQWHSKKMAMHEDLQI